MLKRTKILVCNHKCFARLVKFVNRARTMRLAQIYENSVCILIDVLNLLNLTPDTNVI